MHDGQTL